VLFLVALRVTIGGHFFLEGASHARGLNMESIPVIGWLFPTGASDGEKKWSSEGFLRQAVGPWADFYKSKVPDFHGWDENIAHPYQAPADSNAAKSKDSGKSEKVIGGKGETSKSGEASPNDAGKKTAPDEGAPKGESSKDATKSDAAAPAAADVAAKDQPTEGDPRPADKKAAAKKPDPVAEQEKQLQLHYSHPVYGRFARQVAEDWNGLGQEVSEHYTFDEQQNSNANIEFERAKWAMLNYLAAITDELAVYQHEVGRLETMGKAWGSADIRFVSERINDKRNELRAKPAVWIADIRSIEDDYLDRLNQQVATEEQRTAIGQYTTPEPAIARSDRIITILMLVCGGCLIVGLFTRIAAVLCAAFLFMVMMSQPPWVPGAITTLFPYQLVEFVALITLATTAVGRWLGLDFLVHFLITAPFRSRK
jgi:uncharacterized membrane protein YphA (DoxX/SURF4 family)